MKYFVLIAVIFSSTYVFAQNPNAFKAAQDEGWLVNIEEAYALSKKTNKPIMANFTGSDWCGWCKKLRAEVFSQPEFKKWAKENVVLLELDYPRKSKLPSAHAQQNAGLQQAFQVNGFPTIWVFDLDKPDNGQKFELKAYGKTGYLRGGASNYTKELDKMVSRKSD